MRGLIGVLCMLTASLLAIGSLAGYQVDQLLRDEAPIEQIAGDLPQQEGFADALAAEAADRAGESLPDWVPAPVLSSVENAVTPVLRSVMQDPRTAEAWNEVLHTTREDYTAQLEDLFDRGTSGDVRELDVTVDLTPVAAAITEPLRDGLESALSWVPGVEVDAEELLVPELAINVAAVSDESADPYSWAAAAELSQYWLIGAVSAAALLGLGLLLTRGAARWWSVAAASVLAGALGVLIATGPAAPALESDASMTQATAVLVEHVQHQFTAWAQPAWWIFSAAAGFTTLLGVMAAVVTPSRHRR